VRAYAFTDGGLGAAADGSGATQMGAVESELVAATMAAANNNNNNNNNNNSSSSHSSANHLHTTNEPTGNAADKLEDRIIWVGDLHKLSTVGGDAVLVPLISSYLRRFGPLDQANPRCPLKVRQATGGQASLGYAFVAFEHSRFAEAALRNSVMPDAKLKLAPHKESKYMHDVSWKQGEAEATTKAAAAVATTTPAAAVASAVTNRQPPAHISPPASPEASPPPAQFNTDAPPFASHRASSTTVLATSRSTPTERPGPAPFITTAQIQAVKGLIQQRSIGVPIGQGNLVRYVECAFPEIDKAKVVEAAFGGEINCMVFRWGVADLAALMMKLGYFAGPS